MGWREEVAPGWSGWRASPGEEREPLTQRPRRGGGVDHSGDPRDDSLGKGFGDAGDGELPRKKCAVKVKSRKAENYAV